MPSRATPEMRMPGWICTTTTSFLSSTLTIHHHFSRCLIRPKRTQEVHQASSISRPSPHSLHCLYLPSCLRLWSTRVRPGCTSPYRQRRQSQHHTRTQTDVQLLQGLVDVLLRSHDIFHSLSSASADHHFIHKRHNLLSWITCFVQGFPSFPRIRGHERLPIWPRKL